MNDEHRDDEQNDTISEAPVGGPAGASDAARGADADRASATVRIGRATKAAAEKIERLERAIADERAHSAQLRKTAEDLRFQNNILETSYAKQLEDTRLRCKTAEEAANELRARVAELDGARRDAIQLLTETKTEIERLTRERDQLRKQLASRDGWHVESADDELEHDPNESTINALMDEAKWAGKRKRKDDERKNTEVAEQSPEPQEDMLSPELILAAKDSRD